MSRVLGLDIGTNSIGWTIIDDDKHGIIGSGVRIFEEGLNRKGGREESKNATRRTARQSRRQNARWKARRNKLVYILIDAGMYPETQSPPGRYFSQNPYLLRKKALDEKLTLYELGRVFYHLNQRRGFLSNRKTDSDNENSVIFKGKDEKTGIDETSLGIQEGRFRTLGEYLASLDPHEQRQRNRYTLRSMYKTEFDTIWEAQAPHYPETLTAELYNIVYETIFYQRRLKSQKSTVAFCSFEKNKRVAPKSSPIFQEFRILEQLSRVRLSDENQLNRPLSENEYTILLSVLMEKDSMTFKQIIKLLTLPEDTHINLTSQDKLIGHRTNAAFIKVFGKRQWQIFPKSKQYEIWHTLHFYNDPPDNEHWLENHAMKKWNLDEDQIEKLKKIRLEPAYCNLSNRVLTKIIEEWSNPIDDDGKILQYDKVMDRAGYHHSVIERYKSGQERLPAPDDLRNPIVQQALFECRTVVNAILDEFGKPDLVKVELVRDAKQPKWMRTGIQKLNFARNKYHEEIKAILIESGIPKPNRSDIIKYKLWEECNRQCPFTGNHISFAQLFKTAEYQVEHIIPYSRSLDDSFANKTLCHHAENRMKNNQTPFEAYGHDRGQFEAILNRVQKFQEAPGLIKRSSPSGPVGVVVNKKNRKIEKFQLENADEVISSDFIHSQLNDTAYISREVRHYLEAICEKVYVVSGTATGRLRHLWGLNGILSGDVNVKQREDHRHHAVDAMVVANTDFSTINRLSRYNTLEKDVTLEAFPPPWENFYSDVFDSVNNILVSHRVKNRARGPLHEETNYGRIISPDGNPTYVSRVPIESLNNQNKIHHIIDPVVRLTIESRLREQGVDTSAAKYTIPKEAWVEPVFLPGNQYPIKKVRIATATKNMLQLYPDKKLFVEYGKNHHMEIFENENGKRSFRTVSIYEAVHRAKSGLPLVDKSPPDDEGHFIMSLAINELILLDVNEDDIDWEDPPEVRGFGAQLYRVQKMDVNGNIIFRHHTVSTVTDSIGYFRKTYNSFAGLKVTIDSIGRLSPEIS